MTKLINYLSRCHSKHFQIMLKVCRRPDQRGREVLWSCDRIRQDLDASPLPPPSAVKSCGSVPQETPLDTPIDLTNQIERMKEQTSLIGPVCSYKFNSM